MQSYHVCQSHGSPVLAVAKLHVNIRAFPTANFWEPAEVRAPDFRRCTNRRVADDGVGVAPSCARTPQRPEADDGDHNGPNKSLVGDRCYPHDIDFESARKTPHDDKRHPLVSEAEKQRYDSCPSDAHSV